MRRIAVALCALLACQAMAQKAPTVDPEIAALLAKMRTAYSSVKTAQISTTFVQRGEDKSVTMTSECAYMAPASFRIVTQGADVLGARKYVLVADGTQIRVDGLPGGPVFRRYNHRNMLMNLPQLNLDVLCLWDWKRQLSTDRQGNMSQSILKLIVGQWRGKTYTVLNETAGQVRVRYFVDRDSSLIMRTEQFGLGDANPNLIVTIDKLVVDGKVDPSQFKIPRAVVVAKKN